MQKTADEPPRPVDDHQRDTAASTNPDRTGNCARCGKPLGSTKKTTADGVVCYSCFGDTDDLEWVGVLEYRLDPESEFPIAGLRAARWRNGRLEEVRLEAEDRTSGVPRAGGDYERVGICSHRVWDRETGLDEEYDHLYEIYATPGGRWLAIDRDGDLERVADECVDDSRGELA